jgi:hypothetical protein
LRTEQFRCIYEQALYPKNLGLETHPGRHADHDEIRHQVMEMMLTKGIYRRPSKTKTQAAPRELAAD